MTENLKELIEETEKMVVSFNELKDGDKKEEEYKEQILYSSASLYGYAVEKDSEGVYFDMAEIFTLTWSFIKNDRDAVKNVTDFIENISYINDGHDDEKLKIRQALALLISCQYCVFGKKEENTEHAVNLLKSCIRLMKIYDKTIYEILDLYPEICHSYKNIWDDLESNLIFVDESQRPRRGFMN